MDTALSKILTRVYELEGLLLVADRHGSDTPALVYDRICEHTQQLHEMALLLRERTTPPAVSPLAPEPLPVPEPPMVPVPGPEQQPVEQTVPEPEQQPVVEPEPHHAAVSMAEQQPEAEPEPMPEFQRELERAPESVIEREEQPVPETEPEAAVLNVELRPVGDDEEDDRPPRTPDDELRPAFTFDTPMHGGTITTAATGAMPPPHNSTHNRGQIPTDAPGLDVVDTDETLRVDEKLQRTISKDLRKAFSLNDRFRFRRELFGNSDAEFADAINMIESMRSFDEAREYFLGDLGWDSNVDEVNEFLAIVRNHFA